MSQPFIIVRVTELPETLAANTLYIKRDPLNDQIATLIFTGKTGDQVSSTITLEDVQLLVDNSITTALNERREVRVFDTYEDIAEFKPRYNVFAYVKVADSDPRAKPGSAFYIFDITTETWILLSSSGNTAILEDLSESEEGALLFKGDLVTTVKFTGSDW